MSQPEMPPLRKLVLTALLSTAGVLLSGLSIPLGPTRCFPFQHAINVIAGVLLGPWWAAGAAFTTSALRLALGTGTLFAFPGSIPGALAVGLASRVFRERPLWAAAAEPFGTVLVGASLSAVVIAPFTNAKATFAMLGPAFLVSSISGVILGSLVLITLPRAVRGAGHTPS